MSSVFQIQRALHMLLYALLVYYCIYMGLSDAVRTRTKVLSVLKF